MTRDRCTKDDERLPWLCSCDECSRAAAATWHALMDRVYADEITLTEAQTLFDFGASA